MTFSYDPPEQSLADLMSDALDEAAESIGDDHTTMAAEALHRQLLLHGMRHSLDADSENRRVVVRMKIDTALALSRMLADVFKEGRV
ncbi:hypothetical protein [Streptomyces sp. NPDC004579]|uniref:hypothetical protein n=1 Tax=Streptomyces sp. NPDC004579 TaxID=3154667 RepID=UPI0033B97D0C